MMGRMVGPRRRLRAVTAVWATVLALAAAAPAAAAPPGSDPGPGAKPARPRAYLIYLLDGSDPIVVKSYVEEGDQIRFEKFGGWVGIPRYEILRIVPDEPGAAPPPVALPAVESGPAAPAGEAAPLYVTTRGGTTVRAHAVSAEGPRVRVDTQEGSLAFPRADLVGVLRLAVGAAPSEAWITLIAPDGALGGDGAGRGPAGGDASTPPAAPGGGAQPAAAVPIPAVSDRPHLLQLAGGTVIQIEGFWIEDGEIRFRRLGGVVGFALREIVRLLPQEAVAPGTRSTARFVRQLGPDRLEVRLEHGLQRIRLIGIEPLPGVHPDEDPWATLARGLGVALEFDRQRYAPDGDWLAYVYLPSGRMLNVELIRVGLARPRVDPHNVRYVDLFEEVAAEHPGSN
jgi:endonuclease YncB( thermonuclease family)